MIKARGIVPFLDVIFSLLLVFVCIVMLLKTKSDNDPAFQQSAVYLVVLQWVGNDDVDLWARDPHGRLVGFNRREGGDGSLFSLNRDNLGANITEVNEETGEVLPLPNEEIVAIRGTFDGEYTINSHMYTKRASEPTKVTVRLIKVKPYAVLMTKERILERSGDEYTLFRFSVDKEGAVQSFSDLQTSLFPEPVQ